MFTLSLYLLNLEFPFNVVYMFKLCISVVLVCCSL